MRRFIPGLVFTLLLAPGALAAQVCLGYPAGRGQQDLGAVIQLGSGVNSFGAAFSAHAPSDLVVDGTLTLDHYTDFRSNDGLTAGARLGIAVHSPALPPGLALCPYTGFSVRHVSGSNRFEIPLGFGFGTILPLEGSGGTRAQRARRAAPRSGTALLLYATPEVLWDHYSDGFGSSSDTSVGTELGAHFLFDFVYAGASVLLRSRGGDTVLNLTVGIPIGG